MNLEQPHFATLATISVKTPPFWPTAPAVWFAQVEAQFATWQITQQCPCFIYVIVALSPDIATEVHVLVLHSSSTPTTLKEQLVKRTEAS